MSQAVVTVRLNGTPYQIGCSPGEEAHIESLGKEIEDILQSLVASVGQIGEARLLAMVALILADRVNEMPQAAPHGDAGGDEGGEDAAAAALERAADRILALASKLSSH